MLETLSFYGERNYQRYNFSGFTRYIVSGLSIATLTFVIGAALALHSHFWNRDSEAVVTDSRNGQVITNVDVYRSAAGIMLIDFEDDVANDRYVFFPDKELGGYIGTILPYQSHIVVLPGYIYTHELPPPVHLLDGVKRVDGRLAAGNNFIEFNLNLVESRRIRISW